MGDFGKLPISRQAQEALRGRSAKRQERISKIIKSGTQDLQRTLDSEKKVDSNFGETLGQKPSLNEPRIIGGQNGHHKC